MPFDVEKARRDGASDDQILQYLTRNRKFDVAGAMKDGASKQQIISYLAARPASTFDKMPVREKASQRLESIRSGPAREQFEQAQASAEEDIAAHRAKSDKAFEMLPFVLAAPFTGGLSLYARLALMGGAGLAAAGGQKIREAQRGEKTSLSGVLASLGLGVGSGVTAEIFGTTVAEGIGWGLTTLPKLIQRAAASTEQGARQLTDAFVATRQALYQEVGNKPVDIGGPLKEAYRRLRALPVGKAAFGEQFSKLTSEAEETAGNIGAGITAEKRAAKLQKAIAVAKARQAKLETVTSGQKAAKEISQGGREIIADLESRLEMTGTEISSKQPLDALIREKGNLNQKANKSKVMNDEEKKILQDLTGKLDAIIRREIASNPRATALYDQSNEIMKVQMSRDLSLTLSEKALKYTVGVLGGGIKGMAVRAMAPNISVMALQKVLTNKLAVRTWQKALALEAKGAFAGALNLAAQAFKQAGVGESLKDSTRLIPPEELQATPPPTP